MTSRTRLIARVLFLVGLVAHPTQAAVNLSNLGITPKPGGVFEPLPPGPVTPPGGGGGGGFGGTVSELQAHGYACAPGHMDDIECRQCSPIAENETQTCSIYFCESHGSCFDHRIRWDIPKDVDPARYGMWAREFAFGAQPYFLGDLDGDGRRDLAGLVGNDVKAALSRSTYFENVGTWTGPKPTESAGPFATADVNRDGITDHLSVSPAGHLVVGISSGSGIAASVELTDTYCEGLGTCMIADVDGDGMPDLVEAMLGAVDGQRAGDAWVSLSSPVPNFPRVPSPPAPKDTDGDGVLDPADNCIAVGNPSQLDADGDSFGNACDGDLNDDGIVDTDDVDLLIPCFAAQVATRPECATSDFDGDGFVSLADFAVHMQPALGQPPGPSGLLQAPRIELFTPADGGIFPVGTTKAWVAGYVPNAPAGTVSVIVAGQPVAVSGPGNYFAAFVDVAAASPPVATFIAADVTVVGPSNVAAASPPVATFIAADVTAVAADVTAFGLSGDPRLFRPIVVEAARGELRSTERRAVLVGDRTAEDERSHDALGARFTAHGLQRIEDFLNTTVQLKILEETPDALNGFHSKPGCNGIIPICWSGITISNTQMFVPFMTTEFEANAVHLHASVAQLTFDWEVELEGPNCGEDVTVSDLEIDLRYRLDVMPGGRVEVRELQEPKITYDINVDGCNGLGHGSVEEGIARKLRLFFDDWDDANGGATHGSETSNVSKPIQDLFRKLDLSGSTTTTLGDDDEDAEEFDLTYDALFESSSTGTAGVSLWLGVDVDAATPVPGLGGPQGAFQIPMPFGPPALPSTMANGDPFDVAGAITPNGLNELLDALTRAGVIASRATVITEIDHPFQPNKKATINAGLLSSVGIDAFSAYPGNEPISVHVSPPTIAPVVSGRKGPKGESIDVHVAQLRIELRDSQDRTAVGLLVDARVGVNVFLTGAGTGAISATLRNVELLDYAIVTNAIGADPEQVFRRILCVGVAEGEPCGIEDIKRDGLDVTLGPIALPSLSDPTSTEPGFGLSKKCVQRLSDGTIVAQFGLRLPNDLPQFASPINVAGIDQCSVLTDGGGGGTTGGTGKVGGTKGTVGVFDSVLGAATTTATPPKVAPIGTATTTTTPTPSKTTGVAPLATTPSRR